MERDKSLDADNENGLMKEYMLEVRLSIPIPHVALSIQGITSPHGLILARAFMWNITSPFPPFFFSRLLPPPPPSPTNSLTQLRNAAIGNVTVGGGKREAVWTQLGQTHTVHSCF